MKKETLENFKGKINCIKAELTLTISINDELQKKIDERNKQVAELISTNKTISINFDIQAKVLASLQEYIHEIKSGI